MPLARKMMTAVRLRPVFLGIIAGVLLLLLCGGLYTIGYQRGTQSPQTVLVEGATNISGDSGDADFSLFWEVWQRLRNEHLHGDKVSNQEFVYSAIEGLVNAVDDPNTMFFRPEDSKKFEEDISGSFGGIGAEIGIRDGQLIVIAPITDSPADKAGVKAGDAILKIDSTPTEGLTVNDAVKKIRGPIGTKVVLSMMRDAWVMPRDISIQRATITVPTVEWKILNNKVMHLKLHSFNEIAPQAFYEAVVNALVNNVRGIVLDLRNDPGGFLEVAIDLSGWFLDKGDVVTIEHFRSAPDNILRSRGSGALKHIPIVILVNEGSASASEIMAGALKDNRNVPIVGKRSFGKGTVQQLQPLRYGTKLKITIADWLRPSREPIEKVGITPDVEVDLTESDMLNQRDPQLDKAVEVLEKEIQKKSQ